MGEISKINMGGVEYDIRDKVLEQQVGNREPNGGMGYVILRKNKTFAEQVTKPNTIYEICYNFDLASETVNLPSNCILKFEGGKLMNGKLGGESLYISANHTPIFSNTQIIGTLLNREYPIIWNGVYPNDSSIDCTPVIEGLLPLNIPIRFLSGEYYLSELLINNTDSDKVALMGEEDYGLYFKTIFQPYNTNQRYIIKCGGGRDCLGKDAAEDGLQRAYNIKISNIHFLGNLSIGMTEKPLINNYGGDVTYTSALLILDRVQCGDFSISGRGLHTPFLTLGFSYECNFHNIISYNNQGKSDLPTIQVINDYVGGGLTAITIDRIMAEVQVGPLFKVSSAATISELVINTICYEHTIEWSDSVPETSVAYYTNLPDITLYNPVPLFDINGYGKTVVDNIILGQMATTWYNSADHNEAEWDGVTRDRIKSFVKFGSSQNKNGGLYVKRIKCTGTPYLIVSGGVNKSNYELSIGKVDSQVVLANDVIANIDIESNKIASPLSLVPEFVYSGIDLLQLCQPKLVDYTTGYHNFAKHTESGFQVVALPSATSDSEKKYCINENGVKIDGLTNYIIIQGYTSYDGYPTINVEFYDSSDNIIKVNDSDSVIIKAYGVYGKSNVRTFIVPTSVANAAYVKFYNSLAGYFLSISSIKLSHMIDVMVSQTTGTNAVLNARYYDKSKKLFYRSNGRDFVQENLNYCLVSTQASNASKNIVRLGFTPTIYPHGILTFGSTDNPVILYLSTIENTYDGGKKFSATLLSRITSVQGVSYYNANNQKYYVEFTLATSEKGAYARYFNTISDNASFEIEMLSESGYDADTCSNYSSIAIAGAISSSRPTNVPIGFQMFDTSLKKPIWYGGDGRWIDATGANV